MRKSISTLIAAIVVMSLSTVALAADKKKAVKQTTNPEITAVRQAMDQIGLEAPTLNGTDVFVPTGIATSMNGYDAKAPVYACSDTNGWLVRGERFSQDVRLKGTTMVAVKNGFVAVGMAGQRFTPCQATDPKATQTADHVRFAELGEHKGKGGSMRMLKNSSQFSSRNNI